MSATVEELREVINGPNLSEVAQTLERKPSFAGGCYDVDADQRSLRCLFRVQGHVRIEIRSAVVPADIGALGG